MDEIKHLSSHVDFNNLTYYFKNKSSSPISFVSFKAPFYLYKYVFNGNGDLKKSEEYREKFKWNLNEITKSKFKK